MKRKRYIAIISIFLGIIFILMLFFFQVRQQEVVVVTRFGKVARQETEPGLKLRWPWGIEMIHRLDQRIQNFEDKPTEGLTRDSFNLITSVYVGWKITNPTIFFPRFAGYAEPIVAAEQDLGRILGHHKAAVIGKHPLSDLVSAADSGANFIAIEKDILTAVQNELSSQNYGLSIEFLGIKKLQIPESVTQTVFDRMTAERKLLADQSAASGDAEAQKIRSGADRMAAEMRANAEGQATQIKGKAEAEATKAYAIFQQDPGLANYLLKLNALESSMQEKTTLIFDPRTEPFDVLLGVPTNVGNIKR